MIKAIIKKVSDLFDKKSEPKEIFSHDEALLFAKKSREAVQSKNKKKSGFKKFKSGFKNKPNKQKQEKQETPGKEKPYSKKRKIESKFYDFKAKNGKKDFKRSKEKKIDISKPWDISEFKIEPKENEIRFHDLNLPVELMHGIYDLKYEYCTPIQAEIFPKVIEGKDISGRAQTGTGKTAAFLINIFSYLIRNPIKNVVYGSPRSLILAPTRELAIQIERDAVNIGKYTNFNIVSVFGGTGFEKQKRNLKGHGIDIVVATPGRLLDFKRQGIVKLDKVEILVLDEADRMLDMGFIPDVRQIILSIPRKDKRQTMFFSATLTPEISRLAMQWTKNAEYVEIEPEQVASDSINQKIYIVTRDEKFTILYNMITSRNFKRVMIFANRRDQTRKLHEKFQTYGIKTALLSGEVSQSQRLRALESFQSGKIKILVATDVAARGIHVDNVTHVINYNLPSEPEYYVHRIGRTGRAGTKGISISYACEEDSFYIPAIEEYLGQKLICDYPEDELLNDIPAPSVKKSISSRKSRFSNKSIKRRKYSRSRCRYSDSFQKGEKKSEKKMISMCFI